MSGLVVYPFKLRPGLWVTLLLPSDFAQADARRLIELLERWVVELPTS